MHAYVCSSVRATFWASVFVGFITKTHTVSVLHRAIDNATTTNETPVRASTGDDVFILSIPHDI